MKTRPGKSIKTVGAYEAKTKLPALLKQVERGGEIVISRHHRTIARLVPAAPAAVDPTLFARLRALRARLALPNGETTKDLINAGRRI